MKPTHRRISLLRVIKLCDIIRSVRIMITAIEKSYLRSDVPDIRPGDTVKIVQKIKEGEGTRLSAFEGMVLARKHGKEPGATFTVRKVVDGIGVERVFPLHSPVIEKIEILKRATRVRRAKLYYIRDKAAREVRKKMKQVWKEAEIIQPDRESLEVEPPTTGGSTS